MSSNATSLSFDPVPVQAKLDRHCLAPQEDECYFGVGSIVLLDISLGHPSSLVSQYRWMVSVRSSGGQTNQERAKARMLSEAIGRSICIFGTITMSQGMIRDDEFWCIWETTSTMTYLTREGLTRNVSGITLNFCRSPSCESMTFSPAADFARSQ
jgi:hypothetical protein